MDICCVKRHVWTFKLYEGEMTRHKLIIAAATALMITFATAALAETCPVPPPAVVDLDLTRFYADGAGSIVEPTRMEQHKLETAPLIEFLGFVTNHADRAWRQRSNPSGTITCALTWLKSWAQGGAYLGKMASAQSESQRKWDLAGTALAYIKLRKWATPEDRAIIEPWLIKWADSARAVFDDATVKRNNHWYWLGLALGAVGIATGSDKHWQMAKGIMADAAKDIGADGTLSYEMARQGRALYYHAFATMPLIALAELGASKGEDWYALNDGALHRLVAKTAAGLADPKSFEAAAGVAQEVPARSGAGWVSLYTARFPDKLKTGIPQSPSHRWLGGDVNVLKGVLTSQH